MLTSLSACISAFISILKRALGMAKQPVSGHDEFSSLTFQQMKEGITPKLAPFEITGDDLADPQRIVATSILIKTADGWKEYETSPEGMRAALNYGQRPKLELIVNRKRKL